MTPLFYRCATEKIKEKKRPAGFERVTKMCHGTRLISDPSVRKDVSGVEWTRHEFFDRLRRCGTREATEGGGGRFKVRTLRISEAFLVMKNDFVSLTPLKSQEWG